MSKVGVYSALTARSVPKTHHMTQNWAIHASYGDNGSRATIATFVNDV